MKLPVVHGLIERRILANYQVDPSVLAQILPAPFRPKLINGVGLAGICLIRLKHIRPRFLPGAWGVSSENAAHRIAVEWVENGQKREGVFIFRRDSSSRLNSLVGGRVFPGLHHLSQFEVVESGSYYRVALASADGQTNIVVEGQLASQLPAGSVFGSLAEASAFFQAGSVGYSVTHTPGRYDGLELCTEQWEVQPLEIKQISSNFFENPQLFPPGSCQFDGALLMRNIQHEWHGQEQMCVA